MGLCGVILLRKRSRRGSWCDSLSLPIAISIVATSEGSIDGAVERYSIGSASGFIGYGENETGTLLMDYRGCKGTCRFFCVRCWGNESISFSDVTVFEYSRSS